MYISPYVILRILTLLSLCFVPNSIHFVLPSPRWMLSLLTTNQSQTYFFLFISRPCADKVNRSHLHTEISHNPWGTPQSIFSIQEYFSWTFTRKLSFERHDWNQFIQRSENLIEDIFFKQNIMIYGVKSFLQIDENHSGQ